MEGVILKDLEKKLIQNGIEPNPNDPESDPANPFKARNYWLEFLRSKTDTELGVIYETKGRYKHIF